MIIPVSNFQTTLSYNPKFVDLFHSFPLFGGYSNQIYSLSINIPRYQFRFAFVIYEVHNLHQFTRNVVPKFYQIIINCIFHFKILNHILQRNILRKVISTYGLKQRAKFIFHEI